MACALAVAPASAGTSEYATFFVQFKFAKGAFVGKVDSSKGKCLNQRKIILFRKKNGNKKKLGAAKTNSKGKFKIGIGRPKDGKYFAQAKSQNVSGGTCRGEKSAKIEID